MPAACESPIPRNSRKTPGGVFHYNWGGPKDGRAWERIVHVGNTGREARKERRGGAYALLHPVFVEVRFGADRMAQGCIGAHEMTFGQNRGEDHRPWGFYEILSDAPDHKVKRITVRTGQRLSYQRHSRRSEHWYVVKGKAVVTRNGEEIELESGQAVDIPVRAWHRIRNPGPETMVFIEVQTGEYFGEDDIERIEDDYGRA